MALKVLMLRKKRENLTKMLEALRGSNDFEKREKEIEAAIGELGENATQEEQDAVQEEVDKFEQEKQDYQQKVDDLEKQIEEVEADIEKEEKAQPKAKEEKQEPDERKGDKGMTVRTKFFGMTMQERTAFFAREDVKQFLMQVRTCIKEKRALSNVGLTIPEVMLELLKQKVELTSKLLKYVSVRPVSGTARQVIMGEVPEGIWTEMCAILNEMDLGFNDVEVDGYKVGGFFSICNAILEDNDVALATEIINSLGKAIGKAVDKAILYGKGTKMPLGVVTRLAQTAKPDNYLTTGREWVDLHEKNILTGKGSTGLALLKEIVKNSGVAINDYSEKGLVWVMNKKTHTEILVESMDKNLNATIVAGINNQMPVVGGDIVELPFIPDNNIVFGYFDTYLLAERAGTAVGQSEHARFTEDKTVFKGTARYDGLPVIAEAFGVMTIDTKAPATSVNFPQDKANQQSAE